MEDSGDKLVSGSASIASGIETLAQSSNTYRSGIEDKVNSISAAYGGDPTNAIPQLKQNYALALQEYTTQVIAATKQGQDPSQINTHKFPLQQRNLLPRARRRERIRHLPPQ